MPNTDGEIHLEPIQICEVYEEYVSDMTFLEEVPLSRSAFCNMWRGCFAHVKIRAYKAVSGKCTTCAKLSQLRRQAKSKDDREYVRDMHAFHRVMYMGERMEYYKKRQLACNEPSKYWSFISDGR